MPSTSLVVDVVTTGGTNGGFGPYTIPFHSERENSLFVMFAMSNVNGPGGSLGPRSITGITDNVSTVTGGKIAGLPWRSLFLATPGLIDGNNNYMSAEVWIAPSPKIIPASGNATNTQASVAWTPNFNGGTCSLICAVLNGLNIYAPLDPGQLTPLDATATVFNLSTTAADPLLPPFHQANLADLALLFYMTDDARHDFSAGELVDPSGVFLTSNNQEPAVGSARCRTGLQLTYNFGAGDTPFLQAGVAVGPAIGLGLNFTDGVTPPPIFRARNTIIQ